DITESMYHQDVQAGLRQLNRMIQNGKDPGRFVHDLIYFLRDLLLYKSAPNVGDILERAIIDDKFENLAQIISPDWIQDAIIKLNQCQQEMKWTNSPKVFIEIAILTITTESSHQEKISSSDDSKLISELTNRLT